VAVRKATEVASSPAGGPSRALAVGLILLRARRTYPSDVEAARRAGGGV